VRIRTHNADKSLKCEFCNTFFMKHDYLMAHLNTHTGEAVYKCEVCPKRISRKRSLMVHKRLHTQALEMLCALVYDSMELFLAFAVEPADN
jgi:uncharacterized Zn-finger protein